MKPNEMNKVLFHNLTCLTISIAAFLLLTSNAYAYRTDHSFLPPEANVCAAHVPVTFISMRPGKKS